MSFSKKKHNEGSSDFLFTEHLTLNRENFSPSSYRKFELQKFELWKKVRFSRKKLDRENLSPSSYRKFELQKFELWKKHNTESIRLFFSGNMNSLRVMENSSYRRSTERLFAIG
jgi:hypothetical protein